MFKPDETEAAFMKVEIGAAERDRKESERLSAPDFEKKLDEICRMSSTDYLRQRRAAADRLGVPCSLLDDERKRRQKESDSEAAVMQAHWNTEPWNEPINGGELVSEIAARIRHHVMMSEPSLRAAALWVTFAWVHEAAVHSPILVVSSPEAECGKTTLLSLISLMVPKGIIIVEVSPAVLFRMVEKWHPTLIVDEADFGVQEQPGAEVDHQFRLDPWRWSPALQSRYA